ncbi:MAG: DUF2277 domain-containing protein [Candidatus Binatia bacterium]
MRRTEIKKNIAEPLNCKLYCLAEPNPIDACGNAHHLCKEQRTEKSEVTVMCRNIKNLFNLEPAAKEEIRAASLKFVRKLSGFNKLSKANGAALLAAIDEIAAVTGNLVRSLKTNAPGKKRTEEDTKPRARATQKFSR